MWKTSLLLLAAAAAFAADPWAKVRELPSGSELRIYQTGEKKPMKAKFGRATEDALVVILKEAETSIPKDRIDRIDSRPAKSGRTTTVGAERVVGTREDVSLGHSRNTTLPPDSTSAGVKLSWGKDFVKVYQRTPEVSQPSPR